MTLFADLKVMKKKQSRAIEDAIFLEKDFRNQ